MPYITIKGLKIYHEVMGEGEPIVLLHHGFGCTKMWKDIAPSLADAGYKVIVYDRRGYGRSDEGENFEGFYRGNSFRKESVDELYTLINQLGLDKIHLVGQCEGGVIAAYFAAKYPERVISMVMSSTLCYSGITIEEFNRMKFPRDFRKLDRELQEKFLEWHGKRAERLYRMFSTFGGAYGKGVFDLRETLKKVKCHTLVIYPDRSSLFDVEQGVMLYRNLPKGELCVFPKCGHNTYEQKPKEYVEQVLRFLERVKFYRDIPKPGI